LGCERDIIRDLVEIIRNYVGYEGKLIYDTSKPDGNPRCLDTHRATEYFGFTATVTFEDGLKKTIDWYIENS
jgi:GDP-L-fucose synthase